MSAIASLEYANRAARLELLGIIYGKAHGHISRVVLDVKSIIPSSLPHDEMMRLHSAHRFLLDIGLIEATTSEEKFVLTPRGARVWETFVLDIRPNGGDNAGLVPLIGRISD